MTVPNKQSQHDREIAAIRKLVLQGMKMLVENERQIRKTNKTLDDTNKTLDRFIRSLERGGGNGKTTLH